MSFLIGHPTNIATSPPPGYRLPFWERTHPRRGASKVGRAGQVILYNPRYRTVAVLACAAIWGQTLWGTHALVFCALLGAVALILWAVFRPESVKQSAQGWWRSNRRYRWKWQRTLRRCSAAKIDVPVPLLINVRSTYKDRLPLVDKLRVKVPTGLDPTAFQDFRGELLQWGWRARSCRVYNPQSANHTVELWNLINDPLVEPVQPFTHPPEALPKQGLQLALIEDGEPWLWKVRGGPAHMLVVGVSGSGKGSVLGAIHDALQKAREEGLAKMRGIDPQASELGMSVHLYEKLAYTQQEAANLLEELVDVMNQRTRAMFGITRQHQVSTDEPLYVCPIDEGLILLDKTDRKLYKRVETALLALLRGARKASIIIVFLSQRAELDILGMLRKDFHIFVALQQNMDTDVDMVLGRGALAAGAKAHEINTPGVAYVATEEGIARVRFPHFTDEYIKNELDPAPGNEDPENQPPPPSQRSNIPAVA